MAEMLTAVGVAANIEGVVQAVQTCIGGYKAVARLIADIRHMGEDVAKLEIRLKEADARLWVWARIHHLIVEPNESRRGAQQLSLPQIWTDSVEGRLVLIRQHLNEAETITTRYMRPRDPIKGEKLHQGTPNEVNDIPTAGTSMAAKIVDNGMQRDVYGVELSIRPTESTSVQRAAIAYHARSEALGHPEIGTRMTWLRDKSKLTKIVEDLEEDNRALCDLTVPNVLLLMYEAVSSRVSVADHEAKDAGSSSKTGLEDLIEQERRARDRMRRLENEGPEEKLKRKVEVQDLIGGRDGKLPKSRARESLAYAGKGRNEHVLVEWKEYDPTVLDRRMLETRISDVVGILNSPPSFLAHVLGSIGFVEVNTSNPNGTGTNFIGVIYQLPVELRSKVDTPLRTLADMMRPRVNETHPTEQPKVKKPPLGQRFRLALMLCQTVLTIHNCGWLHKGIRPENVVFLSREDRIEEPYLLGWGYSRRDGRGQVTETGLAVGDDSLYNHPDWFTTRPEQTDNGNRFRKEFDQYTLGCLLLEIGKWKLLADIKASSPQQIDLEAEDGPEAWQSYLAREAKDLRADMGSIYAKAVYKLLNVVEDKEENSKKFEFWDDVVLQLSLCNA